MNNDIARFNAFRENVTRWSTERGIYEHSTSLAQALKAVSEVGELADAVIKNDMSALKDAIGDVAVCVVNVIRMERVDIDAPYVFNVAQVLPDLTVQRGAAVTAYAVGHLCNSLAGGRGSTTVADSVDMVMLSLRGTARIAGLSFADCCDAAWDEIKDRKGRMVPGGAFVKEDV